VVGGLSQLIHLVAAFRAAKAGELPADFFPSHGEFRFCNSVSFVESRRSLFGRQTTVTIADTPTEWLLRLVKAGTSHAFLRHWDTPSPKAPDYALVGFVGGGGPWAFVAVRRQETQLWFASWQVSRRSAPDNQIWSVNYSLADIQQPWSEPPIDLDALSLQLRQALLEIERFAMRHGLESWASWFVRGCDALDQDEPRFPDYVDTSLLASFSPTARRLLAACYAAWVFGGMGSWNDCGFTEPDLRSEYEARSRTLYSAINSAIQGATTEAP